MKIAKALIATPVAIASLIAAPTHAGSVKDDFSTWVSNTYQTDFGGSRYLAFLELGPRVKNDNSEFSQIIVRPLLGYKLTKHLQLWAGYTWQGEYSNQHDFEMATNDIMEQLQWVDNWTPQLNFQYRFRLEQRMFADESDTAHRMRHRVRLAYTIPETKAYLIAIDELFVYFNDIDHGRLAHSVQSGINQNRTYLGVGYKLTPQLNIDSGYQLQYVHNYGAADLLSHVWLSNINVNF